jgi:transcriptional regulator PpsR
MLDMDGVIQGATVSNDVSDESVEAWRGRPWGETVGDFASGKVTRMVADARDSGVSAYRQVNQRFPSGLEIAMEYTTVRLGGRAGLLAVGRNLRSVTELQSRLVAAQQAMEQDYWKLREVETRYRTLFDASNEAVLLLGADNLRILEANPAAIRALGVARGRDLLSEMADDESEPFQAMLVRVRQNGRAPGIVLHMGPDRDPWTARASLISADGGPLLMIQMAPVGGTQTGFSSGAKPARRADSGSVEDLIENLPDAFLIIDRDGFIRRVNRAFLDLVQVGAEGAVLGERLARWLSRPGADLSVLMANLNRHGSVRLFATSLQNELGDETAVEVSAVGYPAGRPTQIALLMRDVGRRMPVGDEAASLQTALAAIIDRTGRTSLRSLVRDAVSLVERHYIGAALQLSDGNRTAASGLLGLSRQGFYKKLAQYDMDGHSKEGGPESD